MLYNMKYELPNLSFRHIFYINSFTFKALLSLLWKRNAYTSNWIGQLIFKQLRWDPFFYPILECVLVNIPENDPVDEADVGEPVRQVPQVHHVLTQSLLYTHGYLR